jgi:hypothetical protein
MRHSWLGLVIALPLAAQAQFVQFIRVGAGAGCDVATVGAALVVARSQSGPAEIRIARNVTHAAQALVVDDADYVALRGGYDTCLDAAPEGATTLDGTGNGAQPVLHVQLASNADVFLERLEIRGGGVGAGSGGGIRMQGRKTLTLHAVTLDANSAQFGGGIAVERVFPEQIAQQVVFSGGTSIGMNNARIGGGIYSLGGLLEFRRSVRVHNNNAGEHGGGLFLDRQSRLVADDADIHNNYAGLDGGGVYVDGGSRLVFAVPNDPALGVHVLSRAERHGGAIYARAVQGTTRLDFSGYVSIRGSAGVTGAAIHLEEASPAGSPARVQLNWNEPPPDRRLYSSMSGHAGSAARRGGTVMHLSATHGTAQAVIRHVDISGSRGDTLFRLDGRNPQGGTQLFLSDSVLSGNLDVGSIVAGADGDLADLDRITVGANAFDAALFAGGLRYLRLNSSVIHEPGSTILALGDDTVRFADHLLVHSTASLPASTTVMQADPRFVDADHPFAPNLRLLPDSPALDFAPAAAGVAIDRDGRPRAVDVPTVPDAFGPLDLGAYESTPDGVFADGFEGPTP